jgi:diguanylate cyclase (GGDEF)-like protein
MLISNKVIHPEVLLGSRKPATVVVLTQNSELGIPSTFYEHYHLVFHSNYQTLNHLSKFKSIDAFILDLNSLKEEGHTFLLQRIYHPTFATIPLFVTASHPEELEQVIQFSVDDFFVGELESQLFTFRLQKFLKYAETNSQGSRNERNTFVELAFMAYYDGLTGLPNRQLFEERAHEKMLSSSPADSKFAILYLDLDGFKDVNDTHDHKTGDWLLSQVAARLRDCIKKTDTVARIGGDEFGILLNNIENRQIVEKISHRVLYHLSSPYYNRGQNLRINASIGISLFPEHGDSYERLIHSADQAMYLAKKKGKGQFCFA